MHARPPFICQPKFYSSALSPTPAHRRFYNVYNKNNMNSIRQIQELNRRELENNVYVPPPSQTAAELITYSSPNASWHADYRDTAYIYIGGLDFQLSEGDVITIFSQYGEPTYINLIRDKETGKSRGFAFLKYEDQRSTDLAVDNLGGAVVMGRTLKVDHTRYKRKEGEEEEGIGLEVAWKQIENGEGRKKRRRTSESESEEERPMLKEERELAKLIQEHDEDDPMKAFLVEEKKEEVAMALAKVRDGKDERKSRRQQHRHHHRSRREKDQDDEGHDSRHSRHRKDRDDKERRRSGSRDDARGRNRRSRPSEHDRSESHSRQSRSRSDGSRERIRGDRDRVYERPRRES
jgi:RNA-binding motif X-linked protein 2